MYIRYILVVLLAAVGSSAQPRKCDQTPPQATTTEPITVQSLFRLTIGNAKENHFVALQTYLLTLEKTNPANKNFTWFMITAEDPDVDNNVYDFGHRDVDVGSLKTLDRSKSRYSEKCANTVESFDNTGKNKMEVHWVSPSKSERVRIRAMVAENAENWYTGDNLTIVLTRDQSPPPDEPPFKPVHICQLCSEARYEVIFKGRWSRLEHPRHYPSKPDENGYSHMIGASHHTNFTLWEQGVKASPAMAALATSSDISLVERYIIDNMSETGGTRTLIRGKRRHHPNMNEWSHSLFRTDRFHHLFTVVVAMRPSPDWFLGTKKFELCTDKGWLVSHRQPLYPWDAGVMDGVSYESEATKTNPEGNIERVEVGSFIEASPFFQTNLNDLKPFAYLEVRRLDVYPLNPEECTVTEPDLWRSAGDAVDFGDREVPAEQPQDEPQEGPVIAESKQNADCSRPGEWSEWSPCVPDVGGCGIGAQTRSWVNSLRYAADNEDDIQVLPLDGSCKANGDPHPMEIKDCDVKC